MNKKKPGRKSKRPDKLEFEKLYQNNKAVDLADKYGVSTQTIYQWALQFRKEDSS